MPPATLPSSAGGRKARRSLAHARRINRKHLGTSPREASARPDKGHRRALVKGRNTGSRYGSSPESRASDSMARRIWS